MPAVARQNRTTQRLTGIMYLIRAVTPFVVILALGLVGVSIINDLQSALSAPAKEFSEALDELETSVGVVQEELGTVSQDLAKATNAVVIPFGHYRLNDNLVYKAKFYAPLDQLPSDNIEADARAVNAAIERIIEPHPFRYWWAIKRFKHRPEGEPKIY